MTAGNSFDAEARLGKMAAPVPILAWSIWNSEITSQLIGLIACRLDRGRQREFGLGGCRIGDLKGRGFGLLSVDENITR